MLQYWATLKSQWLNITQFISCSHYMPIMAQSGSSAHWSFSETLTCNRGSISHVISWWPRPDKGNMANLAVALKAPFRKCYISSHISLTNPSPWLKRGWGTTVQPHASTCVGIPNDCHSSFAIRILPSHLVFPPVMLYYGYMWPASPTPIFWR